MLALIPPLAGAVVAFLLRDAGDFAQLAGSAATILVSGAPLYQRALRSDRQQVNTQDEVRHERGAPPRSAAPHGAIKAGPLTIALTVVLGSTVFWLIHFFLAQAFYPVLDIASSDFASASLDVQQTINFFVVIPFFLAACFPLAVRLAHNLRDVAQSTLSKGVVLYAILLLAANVGIEVKLGGASGVSLSGIFVPLAAGVVAWVMIMLACWYARRTQFAYDAMRAALRK